MSSVRRLGLRMTVGWLFAPQLVAREVHEMIQAVHRKVDASATHHGRGTQGQLRNMPTRPRRQELVH